MTWSRPVRPGSAPAIAVIGSAALSLGLLPFIVSMRPVALVGDPAAMLRLPGGTGRRGERGALGDAEPAGRAQPFRRSVRRLGRTVRRPPRCRPSIVDGALPYVSARSLLPTPEPVGAAVTAEAMTALHDMMDWVTSHDEYFDVGVVVAARRAGRRQLADLAAAVDDNLAEPGPWAIDYTPAGSTGRFFGDYVNWERIDGYRRAALEGPLPELATHVARRDTAVLPRAHPGERAADSRGHSVAPRRAVLLRRRRQQRQPVGLTRPGAEGRRRRVHRRLASVGPAVRAPQVRRSHAFIEGATGFELVPDIDAVRDQHEIVSFDIEPGDVIAFHYRTLHSAPGTAGRTSSRRRAVSFRYLGGDARFATRPWLHSPPYEPITPGEPLDDERFPRVTATREPPARACDVSSGGVERPDRVAGSAGGRGIRCRRGADAIAAAFHATGLTVADTAGRVAAARRTTVGPPRRRHRRAGAGRHAPHRWPGSPSRSRPSGASR